MKAPMIHIVSREPKTERKRRREISASNEHSTVLSTISTRWSLEGMSVNQRENFYLPESFPCEVNALANQIKVLDMEVEHVTMICQDYV